MGQTWTKETRQILNAGLDRTKRELDGKDSTTQYTGLEQYYSTKQYRTRRDSTGLQEVDGNWRKQDKEGLDSIRISTRQYSTNRTRQDNIGQSGRTGTGRD